MRHPDCLSAIKMHIPAAVHTRIQSGQGTHLAEMRHVSVLFVQVLETEAMHAMLQKKGTVVNSHAVDDIPDPEAVEASAGVHQHQDSGVLGLDDAQALMQVFQKVVYRHGGSINKF